VVSNKPLAGRACGYRVSSKPWHPCGTAKERVIHARGELASSVMSSSKLQRPVIDLVANEAAKIYLDEEIVS
jgi:hypothetical protein